MVQIYLLKFCGWSTAQISRELKIQLKSEFKKIPNKIKLIKESDNWYKYDLPKKYKRNSFLWESFKGQKQKWFLFKLIKETNIDLNNENNPEFDEFNWVDYWKPLDEIVEFKREIYEKVLTELEPAYKSEFSK